jgi:outer membrane protein OmpA-like peptidoglycan-associated protein
MASLRVHYANSSSELNAADRALIKDWVAKHWKGNLEQAQGKLYVTGHCDHQGNFFNQELARNRARALANALRAEGVTVDMNLSISETDKLYNTDEIDRANRDAPEVMAKNRRAEVRLTLDGGINVNRNNFLEGGLKM